MLTVALTIVGGMALFLFGVDYLSKCLEKAAGAKMQHILEKFTNNPIKGSIFGAFATAVLQSSGLLMVTMISLINANLMTLPQAIGVIIGQEIGTTLTAQLVAFKIGNFFFFLLAFGFFIRSISKRMYHVGNVIFGMGIVFLGMSLMTDAAEQISTMPFFISIIMACGKNVLLAVFFGAIITAIIQSSSAMTGLIIALGIGNAIDLPVAIGLIFGANIGTTFTGFIASLQSSAAAKRASYAQIIKNVAGVIIFLPFVPYFTQLMTLSSPFLARQIANSHTVFNVIVGILFLPLVHPFARLLEKIVPDKKPEHDKVTKYISEEQLPVPRLALLAAEKEAFRLSDIILRVTVKSKTSFFHNRSLNDPINSEELINELCDKIQFFLDKLDVSRLSQNESVDLRITNHFVSDLERIGDLIHNVDINLTEIMTHEKKMSKRAMKEIESMFSEIIKCYVLAIESIRKKDKKIANEVIELEHHIDEMKWQYVNAHEKRSKTWTNAEKDHYMDVMRDLERISDHSLNIALNLIDYKV